MLHAPATPVGKDPAMSYKTRLGAWMFLFYSLFYLSFVGLNLLRPLAMEKTVLLGMNLATVFGFLLIVVALIQALVYDAMCRAKELKMQPSEGKGE
jgi:uncharacterized membrane protein (DUF485 family)